MTGTVIQVSTSRGGIPKYAVGEAFVTPSGIEGDMWAHPQIHGGPQQAVLIITSEGLAELKAAGFDVFPGALGENITTTGIDRGSLRIGQRWRIGAEVIVEITKPRGPCAQLNVYNHSGTKIQDAMYDAQVKQRDPASPLWGLSGVYASVVSKGSIRTGDSIWLFDQIV